MYKLGFYAVLCGLIPASPLFGATLSLSNATPNVSVGQTFDVLVNVNDVFDATHAGDEVIGFGFDITNSDPGTFQLLGFTVGSLFQDFSPLPNTNVFGLVTGTPITDPLTSPPLVLAILHFQAIGSGISQIGITSDPLDLNEGLQYLSSASAVVPLSSSLTVMTTATPEPSSLLLLAAGLVGLSTNQLRRREGNRESNANLANPQSYISRLGFIIL